MTLMVSSCPFKGHLGEDVLRGTTVSLRDAESVLRLRRARSSFERHSAGVDVSVSLGRIANCMLDLTNCGDFGDCASYRMNLCRNHLLALVHICNFGEVARRGRYL